MTDLMTAARSEAAGEICRAVLEAAGAAMVRHGNDPVGPVLVAAGFYMALIKLGNEVDPLIPAVVLDMLMREGGSCPGK